MVRWLGLVTLYLWVVEGAESATLARPCCGAAASESELSSSAPSPPPRRCVCGGQASPDALRSRRPVR